MALLTVGYSLAVIDGVAVSPEEYKIARSQSKHAAIAVSYGWHLRLAPFTTEQYNEIIQEQKRVAKRIHRKGTRSVVNALSELYGTTTPVIEDAPLKKSQVIQRLTKRVADLETQIQSNGNLAIMEKDDQVVVLDASEKGLTFNQLKCMTSLFPDGITMRDNIRGAPPQQENRVCLEVSIESMNVLDYMTRAKVLEMQIKELECQFVHPATLVLTDSLGASIELHFANIGTLCAFYKLFYTLQRKPVPLTPFMEQHLSEEAAEEKEEEEEAPRSVADRSENKSVKSSEAPKSSVSARKSDTQKMPQKRTPPPSTAASSVSDKKSTHKSSKASKTPHSDHGEEETLSNIADIPPLSPPQDKSHAFLSQMDEDYSISFQTGHSPSFQGARPSQANVDSSTAVVAEAKSARSASTASTVIADPKPKKNVSRFSAFLISDSSSESHVLPPAAPEKKNSMRTSSAASKKDSPAPSDKKSERTASSVPSYGRTQRPAAAPAAKAAVPDISGQSSFAFNIESPSQAKAPSVADSLLSSKRSPADGRSDGKYQDSLSFQVHEDRTGTAVSTPKPAKLDISKFKIIDSDSDSSDE
ncbi:hypothetical protein AGDE_12923 [Angomonas deanei]|nr:hypothetical protein AGDE_12923 [Angomonas deanei]|eukprot:EPY23368.1 hypothetical protein AGDE_12923 [Angomonas deanei]